MTLETPQSRRHKPVEPTAAATLDDAEPPADDYSYIPALNDAIAGYFKDAVRITLSGTREIPLLSPDYFVAEESRSRAAEMAE